jgi:hypothetical protein
MFVLLTVVVVADVVIITIQDIVSSMNELFEDKYSITTYIQFLNIQVLHKTFLQQTN